MTTVNPVLITACENALDILADHFADVAGSTDDQFLLAQLAGFLPRYAALNRSLGYIALRAQQMETRNAD